MAWFKRRKTEGQPRPIVWGAQEIMNNHLVHHLTGVVKFDCPNCKRQTLAFGGWREVRAKSGKPFIPTGILFEWQEIVTPFVCIVCGKTFHKSNEPVYKEEEGNDAHRDID